MLTQTHPVDLKDEETPSPLSTLAQGGNEDTKEELPSAKGKSLRNYLPPRAAIKTFASIAASMPLGKMPFAVPAHQAAAFPPLPL